MVGSLSEREAKDMIVEAVESKQGCKATELTAIPEIVLGVGDNLVPYIYELVEEGRLVEVEYTVPSVPYRLKSFLLPQGTEITNDIQRYAASAKDRNADQGEPPGQ